MKFLELTSLTVTTIFITSYSIKNVNAAPRKYKNRDVRFFRNNPLKQRPNQKFKNNQATQNQAAIFKYFLNRNDDNRNHEDPEIRLPNFIHVPTNCQPSLYQQIGTLDQISDSQRCGCQHSFKGRGRAYFPAYTFYNGKCVSFVYGGMDGRTLNYFESEESCQKACLDDVSVLSADKPVGKPLLSANSNFVIPNRLPPGINSGRPIPPAFFNNKNPSNQPDIPIEEEGLDVTLKFGFGGFGAGDADEEPNYNCLGEEQFRGMCRALMTRYSYNTITGKCEERGYGGCGGYTENSFPSIELCQSMCEDSDPAESAEKNDNDNDQLDNNAFSEGFFLDEFLQSYSEEFEDDMNLILGCSDENPCSCPKDMGRSGFGKRQRNYYYNQALGHCVDFLYKGFGGNANNFESEEECNNMCALGAQKLDKKSQKEEEKSNSNIAVCHDRFLGDMVNSCRALMFRWSYNSDSDKCERVIWGGCDGFFGSMMEIESSTNNFDSEESCMSQCKDIKKDYMYEDIYENQEDEEESSDDDQEDEELEPEPRCLGEFFEGSGNGINNIYYIFDNTRSEPRCRKVSYKAPVIWFNSQENLFPRFIDCRRACQPELFKKKVANRGLKY